MPDFMSVLNKRADEIEKPKPKPVGTYMGVVEGMPNQTTPTVNGEERLVLEFKLKLMSAVQVDDQEALAAAGDISNWPPQRQSFWPDTPEGEYQLVRFLTETLGIDKTGKSLGEMVSEAPGKQLLATLVHKPYINKNSGQPDIAVNVGTTAHV